MATFQTGHIGLNVTDLNRSKQFYQQVFHFAVLGEVTEGDHAYAFLGKGQQIILTLWQQSTGKFSKHTPGMHHLSFQVESMDEVRHIESHLREMQTPFLYDGIVPHVEGTTSGGIYFEDPDGIRLEIFAASGAEELTTTVHGPACGLF